MFMILPGNAPMNCSVTRRMNPANTTRSTRLSFRTFTSSVSNATRSFPYARWSTTTAGTPAFFARSRTGAPGTLHTRTARSTSRSPRGVLRLEAGDPARVNAAHLARADPDGALVLDQDDRVRLDEPAHMDPEDQVADVGRRRARLRHDLPRLRPKVGDVRRLHEEAAEDLHHLRATVGTELPAGAEDEEAPFLLLLEDREGVRLVAGGDDRVEGMWPDRLRRRRVDRAVQPHDSPVGGDRVGGVGGLVRVGEGRTERDSPRVRVLDYDRSGSLEREGDP